MTTWYYNRNPSYKKTFRLCRDGDLVFLEQCGDWGWTTRGHFIIPECNTSTSTNTGEENES